MPGMAGYQFGADCAPEAIPDTLIASGSYANDLAAGKILDVSFIDSVTPPVAGIVRCGGRRRR